VVPGDPDTEYNENARRISARWDEIRQRQLGEQGVAYAGADSGEMNGVGLPKGLSDNELTADNFEPPYTRNLDGQIVGKNGEPIRPGSRDWEEAAKRNLLPLNQKDERK